MTATKRIPRLRIALLTAVGAFFSMAADCETVGTAQDRCVEVPAEYDVDLGLDPGEDCNYAVDCNSGVCMPVGGEDAVCSPWGAQTDAYCVTTMGAGFVSMVLPGCADADSLTPTCVPRNPDAQACGSHECCEYSQSCVSNEDCCSGWCFDDDSDGQGRCAAVADSACPDDLGIIDQTDPVSLCLP